MKGNFLLEKSQQEVFDALSNEDAGILIKEIFNYANTGLFNLSGALKAVFIPIKNQIDKNEESYKKRCEINKNNALNGGAPKGNDNAKKQKQPKTTETETKTTENNRMGDFGQNTHISYINNHNNHNSNIINQDNINNSDNLEKIECEEEEPLKADDVGSLTETFKEIIGYLNLKTGSNYRYNTNSTTTRIKARLNEGFQLNDFIAVIDKKCADWLNTDMEKYLRPETLFGTKFESYLNQPIRAKKLKDISFEELEEMSKWEKQNS